jgi:pyridoxamine 5'-phosphate oxidase-like protein
MDQKNLDIYGSDPIPWARALQQLTAPTLAAGHGPTYWLATVRPGEFPHVAAVGALWIDGKFYFTSGAGTRKSRNLAENPNCVMSVSLADLDLVVEGTAMRVTDEPSLRRAATLYAARGWPARVSADAITAEYSAPSAGPAPWDLYVVTPSTAFGVATAEPYGASRWRF